MNSLLVSYSAWGSPTKYISVEKDDLVNNATILELIVGWNNWPASAVGDIVITDLIPQ